MTDSAGIDAIVLSRDTAADTSRAWDAITEPDLVARWFTEATPVGPVGAAYRLDFGDSAVAGHVVVLEAGRRFGYSWRWEEDGEPAPETEVVWTVEELPSGGSRVTLRHVGWSAAGLDEATRDDHAGYWTDYLDDLAELLNSGQEPLG